MNKMLQSTNIKSLERYFERICGFKPYRHQLMTCNALLEGKSVLLRAPTGSGKSEAVFVPFLFCEDFPKQMIYSLPIRTLVDDIMWRFKSYKENNNLSLRIAGHHGKRLETPLFYANVVVTTIDQTVGAYACTPLALPIRHGNIPAGAVSSAFLVFDEVHTFEPLLGLQAAIILAEHSYKLSLPFMFMSATMPDSFLRYMEEEFDVEVIDTKEDDIEVRKHREVVIYSKLDEFLTYEKIIEFYKNSQKLIVICNTVAKAQILKEKLENKDYKPILLHSRFLDDDRIAKEKELKDIFSKESDKKGILIATQVIEVGLDITCDVMISEVAPIDALIQRAGRCARKGGKGDFYVYDVEKYSPYDKNLIEETKKIIRQIDGKMLDWETEKKLVNEVFGERFDEYLKPENGARILNKLAEGAFYGSKKQVEEAIRNVLSCEVSIHEKPDVFGTDMFGLQRIKLHLGVLNQFLKNSKPLIWEVDVDHSEQRITPIIREVKDIRPYGFYIIHPKYANYNYEVGLVLGEKGSSFTLVKQKEKNKLEAVKREETWFKHAENTLNVFRKLLLPYYDFGFAKLAKSWGLSTDSFLKKIEFALVFHDVGKLNKEWQRKIGARNDVLAHSATDISGQLPAHATISAYALSNVLYNWSSLGDVLSFAIAHHHSVRAQSVPAYELISGWQKEIINAAELIEMENGELVDKIIPQQLSSTSLSTSLGQFPLLIKEKFYRTYCLISRILRFADRIATSGDEDSILKYEEWYGG